MRPSHHGSEITLSALNNLKSAQTLQEFAPLIGYKPHVVSWVLYIKPTSNYTEFEIPKKNGGTREIAAPNGLLRDMQRRIKTLLQACEYELVQQGALSVSVSHGFRKGHSIITNAVPHRNRKYVFNIDLQDFFGTINFGRIRGFFIKNPYFRLHPNVATVIAQIACWNNGLPQGSPCSPIIANLIGNSLDKRLTNIAKSNNCFYSRYADDLTFSTNEQHFPTEIAYFDHKNSNHWFPGHRLRREVENHGFRINDDKVWMQYKSSRQLVTGIIVNEKLNIPGEYRKRVRAMCHSLFMTGDFYIPDNMTGRPAVTSTDHTDIDATKHAEWKRKLRRLDGIMNHCYYVRESENTRQNQSNPVTLAKAKRQARHNPDSFRHMYMIFQSLYQFYFIDTPTLVFEGKTDYQYFRLALAKRYAQFPSLATHDGSTVTYHVRLLQFSSKMKELLNVSEGADGLGQVRQKYLAALEHVKTSYPSAPIILFGDNDDGRNKILEKFKANHSKKEFTHIAQNLYMVLTPLGEGNGKTCIENFLDPKLFDNKHNGKSFLNENDKNFDTDKHLSKQKFLDNVVAPNLDQLSFENFDPLLYRILKVIEHHNSTNNSDNS